MLSAIEHGMVRSSGIRRGMSGPAKCHLDVRLTFFDSSSLATMCLISAQLLLSAVRSMGTVNVPPAAQSAAPSANC